MFEHSALEPLAIVDHPQSSLTNTRLTSLRLCAPLVEHRSMRRAKKLDHPHCRTLGARAYGSVRLWSSFARCVEPSSTTLTAQHSAHEPTALCASDRASLDASSEARPPSLPNTRCTSLRLCAPLIELRSMRRAELDHPHRPTLGARAYGSVRL